MKTMFTIKVRNSKNLQVFIKKNALTTALFMIVFLFLLQAVGNAQDVLVGLTSNGGPEGRGTTFSVKANGADYSVIKGFADWGKAPTGDLLLGDDGNFYGMTSGGGTYNYGTIFMMTPTGVITILHQFDYTPDGAYPGGELIKGADGNLYGVTSSGGTNTYGTIFKISTTGTFTVLKHLSIASDGGNPRGHLTLAKDGNFYGITYSGGAYGYGTIFKMNPSGTYTVLRSMNRTPDGGNSYSSLTEGKDGDLYGITYGGGTYSYGTIFKITTTGTFTVLRHLNSATDGSSAQGDLIQAADGNFYGMCFYGGVNGNGTIFKISPTGAFSVLRSLSWITDGSNPLGSLMQNTDGNLYGMTSGGGSGSSGVFFKITTAGAYTVLHSFVSATEGDAPKGGLVRGTDGNLYGMASNGGSNLWGTAFKLTTAGAYTLLVSFNGQTIGNAPEESLVKGSDSAYYGTTTSGGLYNFGTIFKICGGTTTLLYSFNKNADGGVPKGSLILASDGNLYGTTSTGGTNTYGTIFRITPAGNYTVLRHLNSSTDGAYPMGSLVQGSDGNLYGMTSAGGTGQNGTIFKISLTGAFTVLRHLVLSTDGGAPEGNLVQGTDGNFYGMTNSSARIFQITPTGIFTVLRTLVIGTDGSNPVGSLVLSSDGNFYGMCSSGGLYLNGTIFRISSAGTFKVLKHLNTLPDGKTPKGNLLIGTDGNFYGMTSSGGTYNAGTLFKITATGTYTVLRHFNLTTDGGNPYGSLIIAPVNNLIANAQNLITNEDTKKAFTLTGSGGSPLTYNIIATPKHGKITGNGANKSFAPTANYYGNDLFTFNVSVGCIASLPATVNITINPIADTPVLAPIGNKSVVVNTTITFTATATDADKGQTRTFSLIGAPVGANMNAASGLFTWTPATTGNFTFKIRVTDNGTPALYDEETITVTVSAALAIGAESSEATAQNIKATLYPNPVTTTFTVELNVPAEKIAAAITDVKGTLLTAFTKQVTGTNKIQINVSMLKQGTYFLRLQTKDGFKTFSFIKL